MDLIIELIVWIFRAISGEKDSSKPVNRGGPTLPPVQRGPNTFAPSGQAKPRTLEEILAEVKRQQAQGKANAARPNTPRAGPIMPPPKEVPKAKVPSLSRPLSEIQQPTDARVAGAAPLPAQGGSIKSKLETRILRQTLDAKEIVKPGFEKKFEHIAQRESQQALSVGRTTSVDAVNTVTTMGEIQSVENMQSSLSDKKTNTFADFFKAMRTAPPKSRAEMARRAFVYAEVFGPPRSRRKLRP